MSDYSFLWEQLTLLSVAINKTRIRGRDKSGFQSVSRTIPVLDVEESERQTYTLIFSKCLPVRKAIKYMNPSILRESIVTTKQ